MERVSVVAPMGLTPPVVTEFVQYVEDGLGQRVGRLVVVSTQEEEVRRGAKLVEVAVARRYPHIKFVEKVLPYRDVDSEESSYGTAKFFAELLANERSLPRVGAVYLCVAGGRKNEALVASLVAQMIGVSGIFHVVAKDVGLFNIKLERIRKDIEEFYESSDKRSFYEQRAELFDDVMFPPLSEYSVIKIPCIPYPQSVLSDVLYLLSTPRRALREVSAGFDVVQGLAAMGLIRIRRRSIVVTEEGQKLEEVLRLCVGSPRRPRRRRRRTV